MRFLEALSSTVVPVKFQAAAPEMFSMSGDPDSDAYLYRSLSASPRDLSTVRMDRASSIAYWLWLTNPYAKRGLDIMADFIIGSGVRIEAADPKIQELLDEFWWGNPWNFDLRLKDYIDVLHLFGELVFPFNVNRANGKVTLAYIDPANIEQVILSENNVLLPSDVKIKGMDKTIKIVNSSDQDVRPSETEPAGCFLFQINKLVNAERGTGCLMSTIDLLTSLDDFMFAEIERTMLLRNFVWDVKMEGSSLEQIKEFLKTEQGTPPKPGSLRAHNEKVEWSAVSPDIKAADSKYLFEILYNAVSVGLGIPEHWLGGPGADINRATSVEMGSPAYKSLERKQKYIRALFELMLDVVIAQAIKYKRQMTDGPINATTDTSYSISFPEISQRDLTSLSTVFNQLTQALGLAEGSQWITKDDSKVIVNTFLEKEMGFELPEHSEQDEADPNEDAVDMYNTLPDQTE